MRRGWGAVRVAVLVAAVAAMTGCDTPTLPLNEAPNATTAELPYDFRLVVPAGFGSPGQVRTFHWPLGGTVRVLVAEDVAGRPSLARALEGGIRAWNRAALFNEFTLTKTSDPGEADAVIAWSDSEPVYSTPAACTGPTTGAAGTRGCLTSGGDSLRVWPRRDGGASHLVFRVTVNRTDQLTDDLVNFLVTHELGHVVGILSHSDLATDLMSAGQLGSPELTARDRLTLRSLYQTEPDLPVAR